MSPHYVANQSTISGMKRRDCKHVFDSVTIIANISGLTTTLRTTELQEDNEASYSTCVLALLVMSQVYKGSVSWIMGKTIENVLIIVLSWTHTSIDELWNGCYHGGGS